MSNNDERDEHLRRLEILNKRGERVLWWALVVGGVAVVLRAFDLLPMPTGILIALCLFAAMVTAFACFTIGLIHMLIADTYQ